jgi:cytochrome c oxidase subunit 2
VATRRTLAANTIPNDPPHLRSWITDSQEVKPGNDMPNLDLSDAQLDALVTYLDNLR